MAINKKQTSPWMKGTIITIAVLMVMSVLLPFLTSLGNSTGSTGTKAASGVYETAAQTYAGRVQANEDKLVTSPNDYATLVDQANAYFDWGQEIQRAAGEQPVGADIPMWNSAAIYYERAVKVKPGDKNVLTDMAVAQHYARRSTDAVKTIEQALKLDPKFAQALFNAGIFYGAVGANDKAVDAFTRYLAADPQGQAGNRQVAQDNIKQLSGTPNQ